jgi:hypothetical protein
MTTLEERLRQMAPPPRPATPVADLQSRARKRHAQRWATAGIAALVVVVIAGGLVARRAESNPGPTTDHPPATEPKASAGAQRTLGDVDGVTVEVSPSSGLANGQTIRVRIVGLGQIPGAQLAMCRGDVDDLSDMSQCEPWALASISNPVYGLQAFPEQEVVVASYLRLGSPGDEVLFDCATEPAGCVLAVGTAAPTRGVVVPLAFTPGTTEPTVRTVTLDRAVNLTEGAQIVVSAEGLRPDREYTVKQCPGGQTQLEGCIGDTLATVITDSNGALTAAVTVESVVFSVVNGALDCTTSACAIQVQNSLDPVLRSESLSFAPGVRPTMPRLTITPSGPYRHGQVVTVEGVGFPPGENIGERLGRCPAELDTRVEERCTYELGDAVVDADGTFSIPYYLRSCIGGAGCVLGWVISHGPTVAPIQLQFVE